MLIRSIRRYFCETRCTAEIEIYATYLQKYQENQKKIKELQQKQEEIDNYYNCITPKGIQQIFYAFLSFNITSESRFQAYKTKKRSEVMAQTMRKIAAVEEGLTEMVKRNEQEVVKKQTIFLMNLIDFEQKLDKLSCKEWEDPPVKEGIDLTKKYLLKILEEVNLQPFSYDGEFNPQHHERVGKGEQFTQAEKGWKRDGKIIKKVILKPKH